MINWAVQLRSSLSKVLKVLAGFSLLLRVKCERGETHGRKNC